MDFQAESDEVRPGAGRTLGSINASFIPIQGQPAGGPEAGPHLGGNVMSPVRDGLNSDVERSCARRDLTCQNLQTAQADTWLLPYLSC